MQCASGNFGDIHPAARGIVLGHKRRLYFVVYASLLIITVMIAADHHAARAGAFDMPAWLGDPR
jgi:hypothetical protein